MHQNLMPIERLFERKLDSTALRCVCGLVYKPAILNAHSNSLVITKMPTR
jgi:hypothetical protein